MERFISSVKWLQWLYMSPSSSSSVLIIFEAVQISTHFLDMRTRHYCTMKLVQAVLYFHSPYIYASIHIPILYNTGPWFNSITTSAVSNRSGYFAKPYSFISLDFTSCSFGRVTRSYADSSWLDKSNGTWYHREYLTVFLMCVWSRLLKLETKPTLGACSWHYAELLSYPGNCDVARRMSCSNVFTHLDYYTF